ncbi:hypothetical protein ACHQM5_015022 [Ranunculus cassubicifolius]
MATQNREDENSFIRWNDMPIDLIVLIYKRLSVEDLVTGAPFCCSYWYKASKDPCLLKDGEVDLGFLRYNTYENLEIRKQIIDFVIARSQGYLTSVKFPWTTDSVDLLLHLAESCPKVKYFYLEDRLLEFSAQKEERIDKLRKFCHAICKLGELEGMAVNKDLISFYTLEQIRQFCPNFNKLRVLNEQSWVVSYVVSKVLPKVTVLENSHSNFSENNEQESLELTGTPMPKVVRIVRFWFQCMIDIN